MLNSEEFSILRLIRSKNIGIKTFYNLIDYFESAEIAIRELPNFLKHSSQKKNIELVSESLIYAEIKNCDKINANIITFKSKKYSNLLREISYPPPVLTYKGNIDLIGENIIAMVGSRNCSANGFNYTKKITSELCEAGFKVSSGLARGIDRAAHIASMKYGTIGVIANGIDGIYPIENDDIYKQIENDGLILTELSYGTPPKSEYFPARNRIISGISKGVVVIEAGMRSGTLHTARQAIEQNRELFVAPGNPYDPRSEGSNYLIKDGATMLTSVSDILDNIDKFVLKKQTPVKKQEDLFSYDKAEENKEIYLDSNEKKDEYELVLSYLNDTGICISEIMSLTQIPISQLNSIITELELSGKVKNELGKVFILK